MDDVDHLNLGQAKTLLGGEVIEQPDEVVDVVLGALDIEEEQARVDEMQTSHSTHLTLIRHSAALDMRMSKRE